MKIRIVIIAIVLFGMNLTSCTKYDLADQEELYKTQATDGDEGHEDDRGQG